MNGAPGTLSFFWNFRKISKYQILIGLIDFFEILTKDTTNLEKFPCKLSDAYLN